ncbi:MAG: hypothetical protein HOG49_10265 [Candidatus Scalindua sp.]|nr:hypothetical protein [Candidatus Scalindua sp.]
MIVDLHLHSYYSHDGKHAMSSLLDLFSAGDIAGIADHETIGGWDEFKSNALKRGITPVLGVEWYANSGEDHILSYFTDNIPPDFLDFMHNRRKVEKKCMHLVYNNFKNRYPDLPSYEELLKSIPHPEGILGVTSLAVAVSKTTTMQFKEAVRSVWDVKNILPQSDQQTTFSTDEIIIKINNWNAVSILAHPYAKHLKNDVEKKIRNLCGYDLKGIEVFSGGTKDYEVAHLMLLCEELDLLVSLGSDYHCEGSGLKPSTLDKINPNILSEVNKWLVN